LANSTLITSRFAAQKLILLIGLALLAQWSSAQRYGFLHYSVLRDFTADDVSAFKEFARNGLDSLPDGQVIDWESPSGQKTGKLAARFTYQSNGTTCRRASFQVADQRDGAENYRFDLCREPEGWRIVEAPANLNAAERAELESVINTVIGNGEQGVPVTWTGSGSGHQAVIVPLAPMETAGCRNASVTLIDRGGNSLSGQYRFCRDDDSGLWEYSRLNP